MSELAKTLWLYAITLDDVQGFFSAPPELAAQLTAQARDVIVQPAAKHLIGKVGPLFRHPIEPVVEIPLPSPADVENLIGGKAIPPDRLYPAWTIVRHWCETRARGRLTLQLTEMQLESIDFHLVTGGLSSQFSLETIIARDPHLPLHPANKLRVGWMPAAHAAQAGPQWPSALAEGRLPDDVAGLAQQLAGFFTQVPDWDTDVLALIQ
ncbi:MAG: hypothetical protein FWF36_03950 [Propionibacteriaceae bacterium]|nr:hypothetical protein [Propionibacteriaceae bacterium]